VHGNDQVPPRGLQSLLLTLMLSDKLDKAIISQAFHTEETQRVRRAAPQLSEVANKAATNYQPRKQHNYLSNKPSSPCHFCGKPGHWVKSCKLFLKKHGEGQAITQANAASTIQESAGKASIYTLDQLDDPLSHQANYDWNADSGATSHMTPHKHWIRNYKPLYIPIRLANNTIIYSAGVGNILFRPFIKGKETQSLLFTRVLHVPQLQNNLLAVLFLTKHRGYNIHIDADYLHFRQSSRVLFTASITSQNAAFLDGITVPACLDSANLSSTLPLDLSLWHRRFGHSNHDYVKQLIATDMVTGMTLSNKSKPDPICEPCLAGKMHANPFPTSYSRVSQPLELVHIDFKGPI